MELPDFLQPFKTQAQALIKQDLVKQIEFSGGTYQVQVVDGDSESWAFMQLDEKGQLKDSFCSCEEAEDLSACRHLAAAMLRIYNGHALPIHKRFERSLWNCLCQLFAARTGYDAAILTHSGKGHYTLTSTGKKQVFYLKAKSPEGVKQLKDLLFHRQKETEETSLKFSNLSPEEIIQWKEGKPSLQLKYELSFWNDLAKWLMLMQDNGVNYSLRFDYSPQKLPNFLTAAFPLLEIGFYLSEANLPAVIPALSTVDSPLVVHNAEQEAIEKITYDKKAGCLLIQSKAAFFNEEVIAKSKGGQLIDGWRFVPGDGFYSIDQHGFLAVPKICGLKVGLALTEHLPLIQRLLEGTVIHDYSVSASYSLDFDADWRLHINCYLFTPGDLTIPSSHDYGNWVYLDDDGFYRLENRYFENLETIIEPDGIPSFIQENRLWLNSQEGFQTHIAGIEAQMAYQLSSDHQLSFTRKVPQMLDSAESRDFGPWIYVPGQGFYSKVNAPLTLSWRPGTVISSNQIPLFIRMNAEELKLVKGFFSEKCPVMKSGIRIALLDDDRIEITPEYQLVPGYEGKEIHFFDDFVFVAGDGFHELPVDSRLPERVRHPSIIEGDNLALFLNYELQGLLGYASYVDERLLKADKLQLIATSIHEAEGASRGWYSLKLSYRSEKGNVPVSNIWWAFKNKKRFSFSEAGLIDLEEKRFHWLKLLPKGRVDRKKGVTVLSTLELIRLNAFESIEVVKAKGTDYEHSLELLKELTEFRIPNEPDITGLKSHLRPYQTLGLNWLWFLYHHSLSGLLCDDMGLGKTHQAMALIAAIINDLKGKKEGPRHFLVVCPTSVLYHWQEKLEAFLPGIRICTFYGLNRSLDAFHQQYDILLTSFGIWRMDHELLSQVSFELAIFDEIQIAKNHNSRIHASLLNVNANMRLGLTGTPIENHLRELKSLFDIVLPTYMPSDSDYREFFVRPIEKEQNFERKMLLSRFIKPFVIRRKKEDVLLDLPEKTEEIAHCGLSDEQMELYDQVISRSREQILKELENDASPIPYIHIFSILSSLKQICNHPASYLKIPKEFKEHASGKWELFVELLNEARESEQKVVVFSQYLAMLDIIEEHLNEQGIGYAAIRGSTIDRGDQIRRFNLDPGCSVFVGSLQAAGLGLDLTAGSVVIHYDRWWNAARENQATDRVHRIGQTRGVQVFKLVTKGTFEEKIDLMIAKKGQLMEDVVTTDDHQLLKAFDRKEIVELLQYVEKSFVN